MSRQGGEIITTQRSFRNTEQIKSENHKIANTVWSSLFMRNKNIDPSRIPTAPSGFKRSSIFAYNVGGYWSKRSSLLKADEKILAFCFSYNGESMNRNVSAASPWS